MPCLLPWDLPDLGTETVSVYVSCIAGDSLPSEPPGKPRYVYIELIHVVVHQKLTQHCKAIILKLKFFCLWHQLLLFVYLQASIE